MENNQNNNVNQENVEKRQTAASENQAQPAKAKTPIYKKWWFWLIIGVVVVAILFGGGSDSSTDDQGSGSSQVGGSDKTNLGDYHVEIMSCRVVKGYDNKDVVIVKYKFTNHSDDSANFTWSISDEVYQNGVGLSGAYVLPDEANYNADNQSKDIKPSVSLEVEVAYELNDSTTPIEIELTEYLGWSDDKVTKTFTLN